MPPLATVKRKIPTAFFAFLPLACYSTADEDAREESLGRRPWTPGERQTDQTPARGQGPPRGEDALGEGEGMTQRVAKGRCDHYSDRRSGQRYCRGCHAEWMREHRPKHADLPLVARWKSSVRAKANYAQQAGHLLPLPCTECGATAQKHHEDYARPLDVIWLCRRCHLRRHPTTPSRPPRAPSAAPQPNGPP